MYRLGCSVPPEGAAPREVFHHAANTPRNYWLPQHSCLKVSKNDQLLLRVRRLLILFLVKVALDDRPLPPVLVNPGRNRGIVTIVGSSDRTIELVEVWVTASMIAVWLAQPQPVEHS